MSKKTLKIKSGPGYFIVEAISDEVIANERVIRGRYFYVGEILTPTLRGTGRFDNIKEEPEVINKSIEDLLKEVLSGREQRNAYGS